MSVEHKRKWLTIEHIIVFDMDEIEEMVVELGPEITNIGYDSRKCCLPEPKLEHTKILIKNIQKYTRVKEKTIRERYSWLDYYENTFTESTVI